MNHDLNRQDCEQLLACIDAWEGEPGKDGFSGMLLGTMLGKLSGMTKEQHREDLDNESKNMNKAIANRKEQAVFLRAKLIQLRNRLQERENVATHETMDS